MTYYRTCPRCGSNNDPGEKCDCLPNLLVSETLMVGIDVVGIDVPNGEDLSVMQVERVEGNKINYINSFYGQEAEEMYERLTGTKIQRCPDATIIGRGKQNETR